MTTTSDWYLMWSASGTWIQGPRSTSRHLAVVPHEADLVPWVQEVRKHLADLEWRRQPLIIGLPSSLCLVAPRLDRRQSRTGPLFELEDRLPIAVEDWVVGNADDLFVLFPRKVLGHFADALKEQHIPVAGFVPDWLYRERLLSEIRDGLVVLRSDGRWEIAAIRHGRLQSWSSPQSRSQLLAELLWLHSTNDSTEKLIIKGATNEELAELTQTLGKRHLEVETVTADAARLNSDKHRGSRKWSSSLVIRPSQLLGSDNWSQRQNVLTASCQRLIVAAGIAVVALGWWGLRVQDQSAVAERELTALYEEAFPGQAVPVAAAARLQSERQRLRALRTTANSTQTPRSALPVLARWLESFPETPRLRVTSVLVDEQSLSLSGEAAEHSSLGALVQALVAHEFESTSPSSQQRSDELVAFQLKTNLQADRKSDAAR